MKLYHAGIIEAGHGPHTRSHYVVAESYDAAMALAERVGTVQQLYEIDRPLLSRLGLECGSDNPKTAARPEMTTDTRMSALHKLRTLEERHAGLGVDGTARRMVANLEQKVSTLVNAALTERVEKLEAALVRPAEMPSYVPYHPVQPVRRWWWQR